MADNSKIKVYNCLDLNGSWQALTQLKLSLPINNAFDKQSPMIGTGIGPGASNFGNTFPALYEVIGRRFTMVGQATF